MRQSYIESENVIIRDVSLVLGSILEIDLRHWSMMILGAIAIGTISAFVGDWVYEPSKVYFYLIALIALDWFAGIFLALRNKTFKTHKAWVGLWNIAATTFLVSFSSTFADGVASLFWLNEAVIAPIILINLLSFIKNLSLLEVLPLGVAKFLYERIDRHKNLIGKNKQDED